MAEKEYQFNIDIELDYHPKCPGCKKIHFTKRVGNSYSFYLKDGVEGFADNCGWTGAIPPEYMMGKNRSKDE